MPPHPSHDLSVRERERERPIKSDLKRDLRLDVRIIFHADTELALPAGTKRRDRYRAIDHQRSHQETSSRYTRDVCPRYRSRSNARIYALTHTHICTYVYSGEEERRKGKGGGKRERERVCFIRTKVTSARIFSRRCYYTYRALFANSFLTRTRT